MTRFTERYAIDEKFRERCKKKSREITAGLDDEGRKKRAEYMQAYCEQHPEYREYKRKKARERYHRLKGNKHV